MALGLTQPLTEMSTRNISLGNKGVRCVGLTTLPPSCADCLEMWKPQPAGTLRACRGLKWDSFFYCSQLLGGYCSHEIKGKIDITKRMFCKMSVAMTT
jgi:hypothetical protein